MIKPKVRAEVYESIVYCYVEFYFQDIDNAVLGYLKTKAYKHRRSARRAANRIAKKMNWALDWK